MLFRGGWPVAAGPAPDRPPSRQSGSKNRRVPDQNPRLDAPTARLDQPDPGRLHDSTGNHGHMCHPPHLGLHPPRDPRSCVLPWSVWCVSRVEDPAGTPTKEAPLTHATPTSTITQRSPRNHTHSSPKPPAPRPPTEPGTPAPRHPGYSGTPVRRLPGCPAFRLPGTPQVHLASRWRGATYRGRWVRRGCGWASRWGLGGRGGGGGLVGCGRWGVVGRMGRCGGGVERWGG
jgi:hypothetical protein